MKKQSHQHLVALALAAAVISVSLAMLVRLMPSPGQMLARGIGVELKDAPPETVALRLTQLEALQADALPTLVAALGSDRPDVVNGARRLIDLEFNRWRDLPSHVGARHVEHLARLLATHTPDYDRASREHARDLALRILQWPLDSEEVDRTQLIATCEIVLRAAGQQIPAVLATTTARGGTSNAEITDVTSSELWRLREALDNGVPQAGDDPRIEPELPPAAPMQAPEPAFLPGILPEVGTLRPPVANDRSLPPGLPPLGQTPWSVEPRVEGRTPLATSRPRASTSEPRVAFPLESKPVRTTPLDTPSRNALGNAETIEVMRWLLVDAAAADAIDELTDRGFSEAQIRVARQLIDPDPQVRLKLAKRLPTIAGIDPRSWLLWLSRDVDPNVRRATVAILATSPDPALRNRLRELESEETDASILRVVRRALEERDRS